MKERKTLNLGIAAFVVLIFTAALSTTVGAATITVPDDYPTIQAAIDMSSPGDIVYVHAGTYYEHISLKSGIIVQGAGADVTTIDGGGTGRVVGIFDCNNVTIFGFTIRNGQRAGIWVQRSSQVTIANNVIRDIVWVGIGAGVLHGHSSQVTITNNVFTGNNYGIYSYISYFLTITNSVFTHNDRRAISQDSESSATISYNDFWRNAGNLYRCSAGPGNIYTDPLFADPANCDYHLQAESPCIDEGSNDAVPWWLTIDFEGDPRIYDGNDDGVAIVDMGADEYLGIIEVEIDIKPGSCPNPLNLKSKGVLTIAVLGAEDFEVTDIDPETILLTREGYEDPGVAPIRWSNEDVATPFEGELCDCHDLNGDGYVDLTLKFDKQELVETLWLDLEEIAGETIPLILTGNLKQEVGGTSIKGSDCIKILGKKKKKAINFDLNILFNYATGICIAASDGTTFIYEGMEFRDPDLIYAEEYWGEYQLYLPGNDAFINVEVTYTGSADQVDISIVTEAYLMNTDGSNGNPIKDPSTVNFTATQGATEIIDATFMLPLVPKPLCRFIVKVYHKGKLLITKEGIFCPPDTAQ